MTEPQISPLARRLAEENSIDWRVIPGTGPESRVIERDILTYLARIMSGEIDPPALPDASEPPSPGGAAPDLSEVSNLAAASAGMAKEGIDLSSLLGGVAPAAAPSLASPILAAPEAVISTPAISTPVIPDAVVPEPFQAAVPEFQASASEALPSSDFSFSAAPVAAVDRTPLEQISFGDSPHAMPAAFEAPILFGDPTPSAPPAKAAPVDSVDAEFEIDLDDFDDAPAALEISEAGISAPEISLAQISGSQLSGSQFSADQSPSLEPTSPELIFNAPQTDLDAHQADLVLEIDSTSEALLTIAAMDASNEIDDDLVMADITTDFANPEVSASDEAFNLEPMTFEPPAPVQPESAPASAAALVAPIEHDDFEFDLIDTETLPVEPITRAAPALEPVQAVQFNSPSVALEPDLVAGGAVAAVAVAGGMLVSATHLEPVDSSEPVQPEVALSEETLTQQPLKEQTLPEQPVLEPIAHVFEPAVALVTPEAPPSPQLTNQLTPATPSSTIASGFFQGFAVRRHFDASALTKIQHELTRSLNGREVPLEVFLARAAQRNLHTLGIGDVVTLTRLGDTLEPLQASGLHHSFIEAVQSVARATPGTMQGLLILDASSLGADDLVLPVEQPVLTLNVKGEYGHLALAGNLPMSKAADFLAHIAQALEIPVSLVI